MKELKKTQIEKISQLYRFAEFGRLSSGFFHDIVNPLTVISLNLNKIQKTEKKEIINAKSYLTKAISATKRIEDFLIIIKKQIAKQENKTQFLLFEEIKQAIQILSFKARKAKVRIYLLAAKDIGTYGNSIKFSQIITNLISNAIDSYEKINSNNQKIVIKLRKKEDQILLTVQDWGSGINPKIINKIFEPCFTTKNFNKGTGIGLYTTKNIVENDFNGDIEVKSEKEKGTKFSIKFPIKIKKGAVVKQLPYSS